MSFGFSVGDCILLLQIARTQYKNCVAAGGEYNEIAREVKSLYSVLKVLRDEATRSDSPLLRNEPASTTELIGATEGCRHILEDLQTLLAKYEGLAADGEAVSGTKKLWHRIRFGTKIQALGEVRGKIITYTSTIAVLLDAMQLKATGRLEDTTTRIEDKAGVQLKATGRLEDKVEEIANMMSSFLNMKNAIVEEVLKARSQPRGRSTVSLLSLSTYNEDDKEVWQEFRRELVAKGFRSKHLDRHKDMLKAYMLKLEQCGVLDQLKLPGNEEKPWWMKHVFLETTDTLLPSLQPIDEEEKDATAPPEYQEVALATKAGTSNRNLTESERHATSSSSGGNSSAWANSTRQGAAGARVVDGARAQSRMETRKPPLLLVSDLTAATIAGVHTYRQAKVYETSGSKVGFPLSDTPFTSPSAPNNSPHGDMSQVEHIRTMSNHFVASHDQEQIHHDYMFSQSTADRHGALDPRPPLSQNMSDPGPTKGQRLRLSDNRSKTESSIRSEGDMPSPHLKKLNQIDYTVPTSTDSDSEHAQETETPSPSKRSHVTLSSQSEEKSPVDDNNGSGGHNSSPKSHLGGKPIEIGSDVSSLPAEDSLILPQAETLSKPPTMEQMLGMVPDDGTPVTFATRTYGEEDNPNSSRTSLLLEYSESSIGIKILKTNPPKKYAYAESVAESEPDQQGPETDIETSTLPVPKTNAKGPPSPKTSSVDLGAAKLFPRVSKDQDNADNRFVLLGSKHNTANRKSYSISPNPSSEPRVKFTPRHQSIPPPPYSRGTYSPSRVESDLPQRKTNSRTSRSRYYSSDESETEKKPDSMFQKAAKAAILAGAVEAFRVRNEPGGWSGMKGKRVLTAAIGAGSIDASTKVDPDKQRRRNVLEAVVGGLAANRLVNGKPKGYSGPREVPRGRAPQRGRDFSYGSDPLYDADAENIIGNSVARAAARERRTGDLPTNRDAAPSFSPESSHAEMQMKGFGPAAAAKAKNYTVEVVEEQSPPRRKNIANVRWTGDVKARVVSEQGWGGRRFDAEADEVVIVEEHSPPRRSKNNFN